MDITFYLIELLRLHDCVIVPDLGGFVTNYRPAEMDLATNSFNPPVKELIFTSKLSKNDGLLVNYISEVEGVGYMEARHIISEFVDQIWSKLDNGEQIVFQQIGSLQFDRNEKLIFEPAVHENFLLESYGMEGFLFPQLEWNEKAAAKRLFTDKEAARPRGHARKVKALAIGIPLVLALVLIPVSKNSWNNIANSALQTSNTIAIAFNNSLHPVKNAPIEIPTIAQNIAPKKDSVVSVAAITPVIEQAVNRSSGRYRVIGGCFKSRENADNFLQRLHQQGYKSEIKIQPNGSFLVVVQSYTNKNEALDALKSLHAAEPNAGYWISTN
jgi:cell division septation protein DedD/nucleoid DNA-binding protein